MPEYNPNVMLALVLATMIISVFICSAKGLSMDTTIQYIGGGMCVTWVVGVFIYLTWNIFWPAVLIILSIMLPVAAAWHLGQIVHDRHMRRKLGYEPGEVEGSNIKP